ncbi:hypothetical protein BGZ79_011017 [Entomortierella chlamydospora]|nr:hypothetical protein BGZ79_011017 [Entomortierella chlamydospora]
MCLGPNILPAFEQLGLMDDLLKISYRGVTMDVYSDKLKKVGLAKVGLAKVGQIGPVEDNEIGYDGAFFSRPDLHRLLLSKVPAEKIHFGKRVLTVGQSEHGALIRCADGSVHEVGTTQPLDPEKYPIVKDDFTHFAVVIADDKPHTWTLISVPGNRICWGVTNQLTSEGNKAAFHNSEWGPQSVDVAIAPLLDLKVPFGGLLGDLISVTPKDLISNVYLEEKLFKTWTHGRIALIGDACHKMLPSAGQGAVNAMEDAVIIANCIYELSSTSLKDVEAALQDYRAQRYPQAKIQVENSAAMGKVLYGQTWFEKFLRKMIFGYMPKWLENSGARKASEYRPQATFLPFAPKRGTINVTPQKLSKKYQELQMKKHNPAPAVI